MSRTTDLSTILFPVELRPVGYIPSGTEAEPSPNGADEESAPEEFESIDQYKAVVRGDNGTVFAVVSSRYELLHNSRALDLGKKAFEHLFPEASAADFIVFDLHSTKTGSACHIDLIHKTYSTDVWEQETWLPFLRVSNSYNRSRALGFDFGFVRKLCNNGVIFRKETIQARFYHTKGELEIDLAQDKSFLRLKELEAEFATHMKNLRKMTVHGQYLLPLSIFLLGLDFDLTTSNVKKREDEEKRLGDVVVTLNALIGRYVAQLGSTAYTAMNAATDLATHSPATAGRFATSATLQEQIGERSSAFLNLQGNPQTRKIEEILAKQLLLVG